MNFTLILRVELPCVKFGPELVALSLTIHGPRNTVQLRVRFRNVFALICNKEEDFQLYIVDTWI